MALEHAVIRFPANTIINNDEAPEGGEVIWEDHVKRGDKPAHWELVEDMSFRFRVRTARVPDITDDPMEVMAEAATLNGSWMVLVAADIAFIERAGPEFAELVRVAREAIAAGDVVIYSVRF